MPKSTNLSTSTEDSSMIEGLSHMTFIVGDLNNMECLLKYVLDAKKIYESEDDTFSISKELFFDIGGVWIATMEGNPLAERTYNNVAFKMAPNAFAERLNHIQMLGLEVREGRSRIEGEGNSIYFYDHDNHMFELHSGILEERLDLVIATSPILTIPGAILLR